MDRERLQRSLSCITSAVLLVSDGGYRPGVDLHQLSLSGDLVPLPARFNIALRVLIRYELVPVDGSSRSWKVQLASYRYDVHLMGREALAYHWHPIGRSHEVTPHLHLSVGAGVLRPELVKGHLPTGSVQFPEIVRYLIRDAGVRPLRADWIDVLAGTAD